MDSETFDAFVRVFGASSRRGALRAGLGAVATTALATLGLSLVEDVKAKKKGRGKGKGKGKKKRKNASLPQPCANGVRDGAETDVDCGGGTCSRCVNGKGCATGNDCASAFCARNGGGGPPNVCTTCTSNGDCGIDRHGRPCWCDQPQTGGPKVCTGPLRDYAFSCPECPGDTVCVDLGESYFRCYDRCGAP